jgi:hypothetical protein
MRHQNYIREHFMLEDDTEEEHDPQEASLSPSLTSSLNDDDFDHPQFFDPDSEVNENCPRVTSTVARTSPRFRSGISLAETPRINNCIRKRFMAILDGDNHDTMIVAPPVRTSSLSLEFDPETYQKNDIPVPTLVRRNGICPSKTAVGVTIQLAVAVKS